MKYEIKQLGLGGILDQAVNLLKDNFGLLFGITCVIYLPYILVQNIVVMSIMPTLPATPTMADLMEYNRVAAANLKYTMPMLLVLAFLVVPITNAAIIRAITNCYLGKPASIGDSLTKAVAILAPLLLTWFLQMLAIMGGMILLIIPGILAAFWFALSSHVVVLEGKSGTAALSRSKQLMTGNIGSIFVLGLLVAVIQWGIILGAGLIPQRHIAMVAQVLLGGVAMVFSSTAFVVFYFSCRCKAENFDLTFLADSLAEESASPIK